MERIVEAGASHEGVDTEAVGSSSIGGVEHVGVGSCRGTLGVEIDCDLSCTVGKLVVTLGGHVNAWTPASGALGGFAGGAGLEDRSATREGVDTNGFDGTSDDGFHLGLGMGIWLEDTARGTFSFSESLNAVINVFVEGINFLDEILLAFWTSEMDKVLVDSQYSSRSQNRRSCVRICGVGGRGWLLSWIVVAFIAKDGVSVGGDVFGVGARRIDLPNAGTNGDERAGNKKWRGRDDARERTQMMVIMSICGALPKWFMNRNTVAQANGTDSKTTNPPFNHEFKQRIKNTMRDHAIRCLGTLILLERIWPILARRECLVRQYSTASHELARW
ncbi:hypothetical protein BDZ89DRAFT_1040585 [Hymenopellis radicata]|nr:hypothetical protein BDZ89DRAFT_1040585 [Hymenopellis radicata]